MNRNPATRHLVGVWRLESIQARHPDGRAEDDPDFGGDPDGVLIYTKSGRVSVQFMRRGRALWHEQDNPTEAERALAATGYGAYAGRFEVDPAHGLVRHHVEVALVPNRVGTTLTRRYSVSGDRLTLVPVSAQRKEIETDRMLVWRRARG